ncbi:phosphoenolpyruvate--protein phosphotransferase [Reinekea sp.]|jgi:phosphoenolpyruvate-protein phosphotransferase|uniref:phosphoenolpyruvate--protein phosphotransferase n=1 Tax=Reinekea sp. TaxID=1970455 RepID=UPI003988AB46
MALFGLLNKKAQKQPETVETKTELEPSFQLHADDVVVACKVSTKDDVLALMSEKMLQRGYVSEDYVAALSEREDKVSTYLINGVAIPHGTESAKNLVTRTGLIVLQLPAGVVWNDKGDVVHLAVGIAAKGQEHLALLQQLTKVVMDAELASSLGTCATLNTIVNTLNNTEAPAEQAPATDLDHATAVTVVDPAGMHARPASILAEMAAQYEGTQIRIRNAGNMANAKSMAELLTMGATQGDELMVSAQGDKAEQAIQEICQAIHKGLDGDVDAENTQSYQQITTISALKTPKGAHIAKGSSASSGIAMAPVYILMGEDQMSIDKDASDARAEQRRLNTALETGRTQLTDIEQSLLNSAPQESAIFKAQRQLLLDESILNDAQQHIIQGRSAAWSWKASVQKQIEALEQIKDERLSARVADMTDVSARIVNLLLNHSAQIRFPDHEFILLAKELTPSQTVQLKDVPVQGICTEQGGPNSHMAILARALGLPAIVGIGEPLTTTTLQNTLVLLDAQSSQFIVEPDESTQAQGKQLINAWQAIVDTQNKEKHLAPVTLDGHTMEVVCNIASPGDAESVIEQGGEGVGLLRTEFLFEASAVEPSVEEQQLALQQIIEHLGSKQLVVRTADIGGDKPVSWMDMPKEDNPFLGVRGIRLSFKHEDMFRRQLEAIYRTAQWQTAKGEKPGLHIMFPMIANLAEWRKARDIAEQVRVQLDAPVLPLGIMIEVPSAVLCADHFAKEVDFFSIGSNDLTQYTLAMDRLHPELPSDLDNYHPALLRLIKMTVDAANKHNRWVGVCGNMAADPSLACLLTGLGVTELSISPANVAAVKHLIRSMNYQDLKEKSELALTLSDPAQIKALFEHSAN